MFYTTRGVTMKPIHVVMLLWNH